MKRREFIMLIGGAAAAPSLLRPPAARAQQPEGMRLIGVLTNLADNDPEGQARHAAFLQGLRELGWRQGRNLRIEYRGTAGDAGRGQKYAAELVALAPDVIVTTGSAGLAPLLQVTRTIPIVFTIVPDPVGAGFVDSLSRPGGNATGFSQFEFGLSGKWLELLKELAPDVTRAAVLREPGLTAAIAQFAALQAVAPSRVLSIMASCGIVEREMYGRKTMVRLPLADRQRLQSHNLDQEVIPLKEGDRGLVAVPPREGSYKMVHQSKLTAEESSAGRLHTRDSNLGQRIYAFRIEQPGVSDLEFKTTSFQKLMPSSKYASRRRRAVFSPIPASMPRVTHG
jgi:hypothetical protein